MSVNFKQQVTGPIDDVIARLTEELKKEGFGILTRIDLHSKFREKLGKDIKPVVILGACNPGIAYEAFVKNPDVTSLLPCNAVVRELDGNKCSVELASPSFMMEMIDEKELALEAREADEKLKMALERMASEQSFRAPDANQGESRTH